MQRLCIKIINNNGHNFLRCWNDAIWATKWNIQEDQILCKWIVFIFLDKHQTTIQQQHVMQWTSITYTAYQLVPLLSRKQSIPYVIWRQTIKATILEDSDTLSFPPPLAHFEKKLEEETNLATYEWRPHCSLIQRLVPWKGPGWHTKTLRITRIHTKHLPKTRHHLLIRTSSHTKRLHRKNNIIRIIQRTNPLECRNVLCYTMVDNLASGITILTLSKIVDCIKAHAIIARDCT